MPRPPRRKVVTTGKPQVVFPAFDNRVGIVVDPGPEQSMIVFGDQEPRCYPNTWFRPRGERVKLKVERVPVMKRKRVRLQ